MRKPGALHHARFMSKAILYIKMFMTLHQLLELEIITNTEENSIKRMAIFVILLYGQYFLQTALTSAAPRIDLSFWRNIIKYRHIDVFISEEVEKSIHRQMFYLTEELVVNSERTVDSSPIGSR